MSTNLHTGIEFINAQAGISPLAKDLMIIFQECIDAREKISNLADRIRTVNSFFTKVAIDKLKTAIRKHTGLILEKVVCSKHANFGFATCCNLYDKNGYNMSLILDRMSGKSANDMLISYMKYKKIKQPTYEELKNIADAVSREGVFDDVVLSNKSHITMTLYFDCYSAFLMKETVSDKAEYLSAAEVTAVVLHEIGHNISMLAKAANMWFVSEVLNANLDYFSKHASVEEKKKLIEAVRNTTTGKDSKILFDKCTSVLDASTATSYTSGISLFYSLVVAPSVFITTIFGSPFMAIVTLLSSAADSISLCFSKWDAQKLSDFYDSSKNIKYIEQLADEYVVKHGLGSYQSTALNKFYDNMAVIPFAGTHARKSTIAHAVVKFTTSLFIAISPNMYADDEHESPIERTRTMMKETLNLFKSKDIPDDLIDFYIEDYERMQKSLKEMDTLTKIEEYSNAVKSILTYAISAPSQLIVQGRFYQEYNKLFRVVERIQSNDLFYHSAKLLQLIK